MIDSLRASRALPEYLTSEIPLIPGRRDASAGVTVVVWLSLVGIGFGVWADYDARPGLTESPQPIIVPSSTPTGWDLVLFVHPHCPCTRASLAVLAELVREAGPRLKPRVIFVRPAGVIVGWERTSLWATATNLSEVEVSSDDGTECRLAGAATSGYAVLRDREGRLAFHGGITRGRGQVGESTGSRAILSLLRGAEPAVRDTPVFGCPLFDPSECINVQGCAKCRQ